VSKPLSHWKRYSPTEARTTDECATPRQLVMIRTTGNSQRIDFYAASQKLFGCDYLSLNKQAASTFIDWLMAQPQQEYPNDALNFCPVCQFLQTLNSGQLSCSNGHVFEVVDIHKPLNRQKVSA
jgi:hypothetical protein